MSAADSPTARQKAAGKTRDRIVESARALFHEHGFEAVTTEKIAAAAGVAKGTLFLHARTKERLLVLVYEQELATASRQAFARLGAEPPLPAALARVFGRFFRLYEGDPDLARRFVKEALFLRPSFAGTRLQYQADNGQIEYRTSKGLIRRMDALDWIALVTSHIPDPHQQMVRYYGRYSNASRASGA